MNERAPAAAPIILICARRRLRDHTQVAAHRAGTRAARHGDSTTRRDRCQPDGSMPRASTLPDVAAYRFTSLQPRAPVILAMSRALVPGLVGFVVLV